MWMRPMTRYTVTRPAVSFTVTTGIIVICHCTSSVVSSCCVPGYGRRHGAAGTVEELVFIIGRIRAR